MGYYGDEMKLARDRKASTDMDKTNQTIVKEVPSYVKERLQCLLVDKKSLDFSRDFVPSTKSALAAQLNKNGFKISCKPFQVFTPET